MEELSEKRKASTPLTLPPNAPRRLITHEEVITISDDSTSLEVDGLDLSKSLTSTCLIKETEEVLANTIVDSTPVEEMSPAAER